MKKLFNFVLLALVSLFVFCSCKNKGNISISHKESGDIYKFAASFPEDRTKEVQEYLDDNLETPAGNFSFKNAQIDANIALDNDMNFYIKMYPGSVKIEMDKSKNSYENYARMKKMGEEIGKVLSSE